MSALEVLSERDNIGVIGFDDTAKWVVPFQSVSSLSDVQSQIGTLPRGWRHGLLFRAG